MATRIAELRAEVREAIETPSAITPDLIRTNRALCDLEAAWRIAAPLSFPTQAMLPMTDLCNARCRFCPYTPEIVSGRHAEVALIQRMDWIRFLEEVTFGLGLGEPFAMKGLTDVLQHWRDTAPFTRAWTTTNGSLIRPQHIAAMTGYVDHLRISLNAATRDTYERTMPPLKWKTTLGNLQALRNAKARAGTTKPEIYVSYVISVENAHEAPRLPALAAELGATRILWYHAVHHTSDHIDYLCPETHHLSHHPALYNRVREETAAECHQRGIAFQAPPPFSEARTRSGGFNLASGAEPDLCDVAWHYLMATNADHRVQVCCGYGSPHFPAFSWPTARRFHPEVWHAPALVHLRETINGPGELPICALCRRTDKNSPQAREAQMAAFHDSNAILSRVAAPHVAPLLQIQRAATTAA
ncbi:MAG: radical SAM protein [Vicinamibacterales bacterium]